MRPRALLRIVVALLVIASLVTAFIFALKSPKEPAKMYQCFRAISYAIMALVFATAYRYLED